MQYELRLLESDGRAVAAYALDCADDERAKSSVLAMSLPPYNRYQIWRGMEKIADGARFICNDHLLASDASAQKSAFQ